MSLTAGQQRLVERVVTMNTTANIMQPDGDMVQLPRYVIQASGGTQRTRAVQGLTDAYPEIVVRVETESGQFTTQNDALVSDLVARFNVGDRFNGITITEAPLPRPPLSGGGVYAIPVIIRGHMTF